MKNFHHTNVLPLIGLTIDEEGQLMVITPYMKHGDILSYIRDARNVRLRYNTDRESIASLGGQLL